MSASVNIVFSTTDHLLSRIIRWVTKSEASHALITYRDETLGKVMVMEAVGVGFRVIPWTRWRQKNTLVARYSLRVDEKTISKALQSIAELLGSEYDTTGAAGWVLRHVVALAKNPVQSPYKLFCSEAVALFIEKLGIKLGSDSAWQSPQDLLDFVSRHIAFKLEERAP